MLPFEKIASVLRQVHPAVFANVIPPEEEPAPTTAIIYRESSEVRVTNFRGSLRESSIFRVQFQSRDFEEADDMSRKFLRLADRQTPRMVVTDVASFYSEERRLQLREATVIVR